jgi:hypothetical protein
VAPSLPHIAKARATNRKPDYGPVGVSERIAEPIPLMIGVRRLGGRGTRPNFVSELGQFARPIMRRGTRLRANATRLQRLEKRFRFLSRGLFPAWCAGCPD